MAAAGQCFLRQYIKPAPTPLIYRLSHQALFGYDYFDGLDLARQTFSQGAKPQFDATRNEGLIVPAGALCDGPKAAPDAAIHAGKEILWDVPNARLLVDTPTCQMYVGRPAPTHRFADGLALSGVPGPRARAFRLDVGAAHQGGVSAGGGARTPQAQCLGQEVDLGARQS